MAYSEYMLYDVTVKKGTNLHQAITFLFMVRYKKKIFYNRLDVLNKKGSGLPSNKFLDEQAFTVNPGRISK